MIIFNWQFGFLNLLAFCFVWFWVAVIAHFLVCVYGCFLGLVGFWSLVGCVVGVWLHNHVGFIGCGYGACWGDLVVRGFLRV